jgi:DNA-directed RNA polymerase subunit RPC12/RpoP
MSEWDHEANQAIYPNELTRNSNKKVSWICSMCGNKWKTSIYHRAARGTGCRNCYHERRKKISVKESIVYTNPEASRNWHPIKNIKLTPDLFKKGSRYQAWWKCQECGREWKSPIKSYSGCSECKKKNSLLKRSLEAKCPELMNEWHKVKNKNISPSEVYFSTHQKAWWKCSKCKYEWETKINNRAVGKRGCPLCANKVVVEGINDLGTTHPHLAKEWHLSKNDDTTPQKVTFGNGKKVWWTCPNGHDYQATTNHRTSGTDCPKCFAGTQTSFAEQAVFYYVKKLYSDAISRYKAKFLGKMELDIYIPSIKTAIEYDGEAWHKEENTKREELKYRKCKKNYITLIRLKERQPRIETINADYIFSRDKLYLHENLEPLIKVILNHLNFGRSFSINGPVDVNLKRDRFEIQKYRTILKKDSLLDKFPKLANEWHDIKNGKLSPAKFKPGSDHKVWWLCPVCNHEYEASIGHRTRGTGCPYCGIKKSNKAKHKPVNMIDPDTGIVLSKFTSITEASLSMRINGSNISMVCKGKRPKAGGYIWKYAD